jgi:hypothetical protein
MANKGWFQKPLSRAAASVLSQAVSLAANFFIGSRPFVGFWIVLVGTVISVLLFLPELRSLKITVPKNTIPQSPVWLYIFALASIGMTVTAGVKVYLDFADRPTSLTPELFSSHVIAEKHVKIADFADSRNVISGRDFEDSFIYGPAVLFMSDRTVVGDNQFVVENGASSIVALPDGTNVGPNTGIIIVEDDTFKRCRFFDVTVVVSAKDLDRAKAGFIR